MDLFSGNEPFPLTPVQGNRNAKIVLVKAPIRLLAIDIDGTLLNPQFQISDTDLAALRRAHSEDVEVILVTGRRHTFALPIAQQLGFDLWLISSNGAVTRSLSGETFHRDLLPAATCRKLCAAMQDFRGNTMLTFDTEVKGAIVLEHMQELNASIQRWLEKNMQYIDFVIPIEKSLTADPVQAMFCGPIPRMQHALALQIADKLAAAAQKARILDPLDRAADIPVRSDHGLFACRYAARASSTASTIGI